MGAMPGALIRWQINDDFAVNIFGSIIIGFLAGMQVRQKINLLFVIGFCGALTTFSSWMMNCLQLILDRAWLGLICWITFSVSIGLLAVGLGFVIGRQVRNSARFQ